MAEKVHWSPGESGGFKFLGGVFEVDEPDNTPAYEAYEYTSDLHGDPGEGWEEISQEEIPAHEPIRTPGMAFI